MKEVIAGYLDFAERQAKHKHLMAMHDWSVHLDPILAIETNN